jgi:hypothetical protein
VKVIDYDSAEKVLFQKSGNNISLTSHRFLWQPLIAELVGTALLLLGGVSLVIVMFSRGFSVLQKRQGVFSLTVKYFFNPEYKIGFELERALRI